MSKSIISNERECLICGRTYPLHVHHIYAGHGRRDLSEAWGCWVWLCPEHHNMGNNGVHFNRHLDLMFKRLCQSQLEADGWTRSRFIQTFGKNYIEDETDE